MESETTDVSLDFWWVRPSSRTGTFVVRVP